MLTIVASSFYNPSIFNFNFEGDKSAITMVANGKDKTADAIVKGIETNSNNILLDDTKSNFTFEEMLKIKEAAFISKIRVTVISNNMYWIIYPINRSETFSGMYGFAGPIPILGYGLFGETILQGDVYKFIEYVELSEKIEKILKSNKIDINISEVKDQNSMVNNYYPQFQNNQFHTVNNLRKQYESGILIDSNAFSKEYLKPESQDIINDMKARGCCVNRTDDTNTIDTTPQKRSLDECLNGARIPDYSINKE